VFVHIEVYDQAVDVFDRLHSRVLEQDLVEKEFIHNRPYAPLIGLEPLLPPYDLRCDVEWRAEEWGQFLLLADQFHVALVDHLEVALLVQHQVGWFDVPVDQTVLVQEP